MSENLDLVRSVFANWERGDYGSAEWADPEIEWVVAEGPDPGTWTGVAGMVEGWQGQLGAWENWRVHADDYRELDDERVLVLTDQRGRGKRSGLEAPQEWRKGASLFHLRNGKVTRLALYWNRERALADLGLEE